MPSGGGEAFDGHANGRFTVPPATNGLSLSAGCYVVSANPGCTDEGYFRHYHLFPVLLGTEFPITFSGETGAGSSFENTGNSHLSEQYAFRFFEADSVTPVAVEEIPEPGLAWLVLLLVVALSVYRVRTKPID
jgi:hypothetical protein